MTARLAHNEIRELLGAYALNAVDGDEADVVDLHVRECPRCRAEVEDFREAASLLAIGHPPAPVSVWDAIVAATDAPSTRPRAIELGSRRRRLLTPQRLVAGAAAAVLVAAVAIGGVLQDRRIGRMQSELTAMTAESQPGARRVDLRTGDGRTLARAVLGTDGRGYLWGSGLPRLSDDRTYQLWFVTDGRRVSAGVLGTSPGLVPFTAADTPGALAITEEHAGGVTVSTRDPVVLGAVAT